MRFELRIFEIFSQPTFKCTDFIFFMIRLPLETSVSILPCVSSLTQGLSLLTAASSSKRREAIRFDRRTFFSRFEIHYLERRKVHAKETSQLHTRREGPDPQRHLVEGVAVSVLCEYHLQPKVFYSWQQQLFEGATAAFTRGALGSNRTLASELVIF